MHSTERYDTCIFYFTIFCLFPSTIFPLYSPTQPPSINVISRDMNWQLFSFSPVFWFPQPPLLHTPYLYSRHNFSTLSSYSINFGQTVLGSWWSYWFVGNPNFLRSGTTINGKQTPTPARAHENAIIGCRWIIDLNHPLPYIPWVTPMAPPMVVSMPNSWPSIFMFMYVLLFVLFILFCWLILVWAVYMSIHY